MVKRAKNSGFVDDVKTVVREGKKVRKLKKEIKRKKDINASLQRQRAGKATYSDSRNLAEAESMKKQNKKPRKRG